MEVSVSRGCPSIYTSYKITAMIKKYNEFVNESKKMDKRSLSNELEKIAGKNRKYQVRMVYPNSEEIIKAEFDDKGNLQVEEAEVVNEGIRKNLLIGAVCTVLSSGLVSCKKEDFYDIGKDSRFIVKPRILDTLDKENFDSPNKGDKKNVYLWYGNQSGNGSRPAYFDYTSKVKDYGAKTKEYPDSVVSTGNGITPNEVIKVVKTSDTKFELSQSDKSKWKYLVLIKVHPSTQWDWSDPNRGKEEPADWKTGYALYLTNQEGIEEGDLYPTFIERIYGLNRDSKGNPISKSEYKPIITDPTIKNFVDNWSSALYKTAPEI